MGLVEGSLEHENLTAIYTNIRLLASSVHAQPSILPSTFDHRRPRCTCITTAKCLCFKVSGEIEGGEVSSELGKWIKSRKKKDSREDDGTGASRSTQISFDLFLALVPDRTLPYPRSMRILICAILQKQKRTIPFFLFSFTLSFLIVDWVCYEDSSTLEI